MLRNLKIYDKSNRILAYIDNSLNLSTTYKYKQKRVIISRNLLNYKKNDYNSWINYSEKDTHVLIELFLIGHKVSSWSISKKYKRVQKFDKEGREVYYKRKNLSSGVVLEKRYHYSSESSTPIEIETYNGEKTLISIAAKNIIDTWKNKKK